MINEELKKEENRKKFREMVMKYHPDKGGDPEIMKRLNASRDSDEMFEKFISDLMGKKAERPKSTYNPDKDLNFNRRSIQISKLMKDDVDFITTLEANMNNLTMKIRVSKKDGYPRKFKYIDGIENMSDNEIKISIDKAKKELSR